MTSGAGAGDGGGGNKARQLLSGLKTPTALGTDLGVFTPPPADTDGWYVEFHSLSGLQRC